MLETGHNQNSILVRTPARAGLSVSWLPKMSMVDRSEFREFLIAKLLCSLPRGGKKSNDFAFLSAFFKLQDSDISARPGKKQHGSNNNYCETVTAFFVNFVPWNSFRTRDVIWAKEFRMPWNR